MQRATTHCFGAELDEEVLEVAAGEQLEHDVARQLLEADADEGDDVGVLELAHDERLHQEVHLGLLGAQLGQRLPNTQPARSMTTTTHVCTSHALNLTAQFIN